MTVPKLARPLVVALCSIALILGTIALLIGTPLLRPVILSHASGLLSRALHQNVRVGSATGDWPTQIILNDVSVADAGGPWLTIDRLDVRWRPLALLRAKIVLDQVEAGTIHLMRLPPESPSTGPAQPPPLAQIRRSLRRITLDRLTVTTLQLDAPVLGRPGVIGIAGTLKPDGAGVQTLALSLTRKDQPGTAALALKLPRSGFSLAVRAGVADVGLEGTVTLAQDNGALGGAVHLSCGGANDCVTWSSGKLQQVTADIAAAGTVTAPQATATFHLENVADGKRAVSQFDGELAVAPTDQGIRISGQGALRGTDKAIPELARILSNDGTWSFAGQTRDSALDITKFTLHSGDTEFALAGTATASALTDVSATLSARGAARLIGIADTASRTRLALTLDRLVFAPTALSGHMDATVEQPPAGMSVPPLLSGTLTLASAITLDARALSLTDMHGTWGGSTFTGTSTWPRSPTGLDHGASALTLTTAPTAIAGATQPLHTEVTLSGGLATLDAEIAATTDNLGLAGAPVQQVAVKASVHKNNALWNGTLDLAARWRGAPLHVTTPFNQPDSTTLAFTGIDANILQAALHGALRVNIESGLITGGLSGPVNDVAPLFSVVGLPASGNGKVMFAFADKQGQELAATLDAGAFEGPDVRADSLSARITLGDLWHKRRIAARIAANEGDLFGRRFSQATVTANGGFDRVAVTVQAQNAGVQPLKLDAGGTVAIGNGTAVALEHFVLETTALHTHLIAPTCVTFAQAGITLAPTQIAVNDGSIAASLAIDNRADRITGQAQLTHVTVGQLTGPLASAGQSVLDGSIKIGGVASAADVDATLGVQYTARDVGGGPIVATLAIANHNGRATVTGTATGLSTEVAKLTAEFPARLDARAFRATFDMGAPIKGALTWHGDIKPLWQLLAYDQHALAGRAEVDLAVSGSIGQPRIAGGLKLSKASYENFASGTAIRDLDAAITAENTDSFAVKLSGNDTDGGKITAQGTFSRDANGHWAVDAGGDLNRFHVLRRDDATAATTGHVTYKGPLTSGTLSGRLQVVRSELRLGATYMPEIPLLRAKMSLAQADEKPSSIKLDITLAIDDVIRVEGKGLEAFWRGQLHAQGTLDTPDISGTLTLARGTFTFLGQSFDLTQGTITFTGGGKIDPELSIIASKASGTLTATVTVTGPASHPNIALSSTPVMPQDEVLAQLLFRKGTGQLGPLESLQLASAAADLAGLSQGGLTGMLRRTFGLDIVSFGGKSGQSVVLGHQISSSLYVGVEQSVATSSERQLVVEWRLTRSLSIESTTDQQTGADIGVIWRKDY